MDRRPLCLLADSQLLFWKDEANALLALLSALPDAAGHDVLRAAYVGASNGDQPEYFELFSEAMDGVGRHNSLMIPSRPDPGHMRFIADADVVLLAGGDVTAGWDVLQANGVADVVRKRYYAGALVVGVSAGAMQMGLGFRPDDDRGQFIDALRLVPHYLAAHDEADEWRALHALIGSRDDYGNGLGIAAGGGLLYHADGTVEPIRRPVTEISRSNDPRRGTVASILLPPADATDAVPTASEALVDGDSK